MINKLTFLSVLFLLSFKAYAVNVPAIGDTNKVHILDNLTTRQPYPYEYKLNRNQYIIKYGFDSESKRIINNYFNKQKLYIWYIASPTIIYFLIFFFYFLSIVTAFAGGVFILAMLLLILSVLAWFFAWGLRVFGIIKLAELRKIDLLFELINYRKISGKANKATNDDDYYRIK